MTIDFSTILPQYTPDAQIETDWTSQKSALPTGTKKTLLLGHKTSAGSEAASSASIAKPIYSVNDAIAKWGKGSDIAVMAEAFISANNKTPLYGIAYAEAGGGVTASGTITIASSSGTATGNGTVEVWIAGGYFSVPISSGVSTPTTVAAAMVAKINAHSNLPVTAANTAGVITVTHRTKGTHGNTVTMRTKYTSGVDITSTCGAAALASGATDGDASDALSAVEADRYHIIVFNLNNESTASAEVVTHQETQSGVAVQKWGGVIMANVGTLSNATTLAANAASIP
jgi:phage tail sheath gpL-like